MTDESCRLYLTADKPTATAAYEWLSQNYEDDGYAVALQEIDEKKQVFEASVYPLDQVDAIATRFEDWIARNASSFNLQRETFEDVDWVARSLEGLKPVHAGRISVHGHHDCDSIAPGRLKIEIEAGQAFGTGHHGTTSGCLLMLQQIMRSERPGRILDLGTGSAVLAIAAAKLAPASVLATDIDPVAVSVARQNIDLNGVASRVKCCTATGFAHPAIAAGAPYDLIVANILAGPLKKLAPEMARHVTAGGSILLSGILDEQRRSVIAAYSGQNFRHIRTIHLEGWSTIHLKR
ncbi:50S ribosomal protein L11 methyltransferase [Notoacmeibacter ruber]|uniref:Ribosomal protein L11 methyltransferase n=1 Tax=Notoacmeibacter ruber TaxID=2670375 RepID=A0A3L7JCG2_9HYPH|nr:50S ribosomal protein L11 methyltransferase [Notoacmeibacter ruber]RLQ88170.1 50S ribosomal protein L11 methyltransferase [Notoacmeibacter ruber]